MMMRGRAQASSKWRLSSACVLLAAVAAVLLLLAFLAVQAPAPAVPVPVPAVGVAVDREPAALSVMPPPPDAGRKRYAFAITITKDGFFLDGAAVLAYSIMKATWQADYSISFVAFVHPNVTLARPGLRQLGYHVVEVPVPVNVSAIRFAFLREKINKNGCCGAAELIKLTSYRLTQYERVVHLDADALLLRPLDALLALDRSLVYTTDPNMATFHKLLEQMPAQGGFLVLRPSEADYAALIATHMGYDFRKNHGWNGSHIGWYWGGMTVQGLLPFYYHRISAPNRTAVADRCLFNTMADTPPCEATPLADIVSAHFTVCQKPWNCMLQHVNALCGQLHGRWVTLRDEAEAFYTSSPTSSSPLPSACRGSGLKSYRPFNLTGARLPVGHRYCGNVLADDSPDRFLPVTPQSGYLPDAQHFD